MNVQWELGCFLALATVACGNADETDSDPYDAAVLEEYRSAIPSEDNLSITVRDANPNAVTVAGNAQLANMSIGVAVAVNSPVVALIGVLRTLVALPPTVYNSAERRFVWGPFDNDDGFGQVAVYIQENDPGEDLRFTYAFVRLAGRDLATATPVIWGAGTPSEVAGEGVGVTLWDFVANDQFEASSDPDYDPDAARTQGRFAALYGTDESPEGQGRYNVATFRNFLPDDAVLNEEPFDADYFFGHFDGNDGNQLDFLNFELDRDFCDAAADTCFDANVEADAMEHLNVYSVFYNRGVGRGEAVVSSGDLSETVAVSECWNALLNQVGLSVSVDGSSVAEQGACEEPFTAELSSLDLPSLEDVDSNILVQLGCVADNGLADCQ